MMNNHAEARHTLSAKIKALLIGIMLLAFFLSLPSVRDGLSRDDFFHRSYLLGYPILPDLPTTEPPSLVDAADTLFSFFNEEKNTNLSYGKQTGWIPWWASNELKVDFWRPVAAITHWVDYQLWPESPELIHLHSIIWYLLLVCSVFSFFRALNLQAGIIAAALSLYALDASHSEAIAWVANRNILIAATFGFWGMSFLLSYVSYREHRHKLLFSALLVVLSLLSAEGGIAILPFAVLAVLFRSELSLSGKLTISSLFFVIFLAWQVIYIIGGHGASQSGVYINPITDTRSFLSNGLSQWPILFMDQVTGLESLQILMSDAALGLQTAIAFVFCFLFILLLLPLLKNSRSAVYLLLSAIAALVPAGTTILTGGRLMFFSGVALSGLLAMFGHGLIQNAQWVPARRWYKILAKFALGAIILIQISANGYIWYSQILSKLQKPTSIQLSKYTDFTRIAYNKNSTIIVVNPPIAFDMMYAPIKLSAMKKEVPASALLLVPGISSIQISRIDDRTLTILCELPGCPMDASAPVGNQNRPTTLANGMQRLDSFFSAANTKINKVTSLPQASFTIVERYENNQPKKIMVKFTQLPEEKQFVWVSWDNNESKFTSWKPPAVGEQVSVQGYIQ